MNSEKQEKNKYINEAKYHQIAVELAEKIAEGWYVVGEKLSARSMVANTFHVSTETARKAVQILVDMGILTSKHGSGTYVASREKAQLFFNRHQELISIEETREKLQKKVIEQKNQFDTIINLLNELVTQTQRDHNTAYIIPYDMKIDKECNYLGSSIGEIDIWQETGATIVAVKRGDDMFISPGPYEIINDGDILLFVGGEDSRRKMMTLFNVQP
ncbi:MAG: GntR family transcriptional regulator [Eubacteriales bacterium]|nr:GntR family transcriptional regulator [Eubacteriales bacterium]MDY3332320.1 GntR family transcriptional regulator [Gallibacter sp.]